MKALWLRWVGIVGLVAAVWIGVGRERTSGATPAGIVFEAEEIAGPKDAWRRDDRVADRWTLWTKEADIDKKRSRGAVMASPAVAKDRATPEEGAPPLHCVVTNLAPGAYGVFISAPGRPLAYSLDGKAWSRYQGGDLAMGMRDLRSGRFEFWIDDRFAHPGENPGPGYFDYVRFVPVEMEALAVERFAAWPGMDSVIQGELGGKIVPARACQLHGFEADGKEAVKADGPPAKIGYEFDGPGRFYVGVQMVDDKDGIERLDVLLNGRRVGLIVGDADTDGRALFRLKEPLDVRAGDVLTLEPKTRVGMYRVDRLVFSAKPLIPPPPRFGDFESWCPGAGTAHLCWTTSRPVAGQRLAYSSSEGDGREIEIGGDPGRNHRVILSGLDPSREYGARISVEFEGGRVASEPFVFRATVPEAGPTSHDVIPLSIDEPTAVQRGGAPALVGVPFALGKLARVEDLRLFAPSGEPARLQAEVFARWRDGSVKLATLAFYADTRVGASTTYRLESRPSWPKDAPARHPAVVVKEDDEAWRIGGAGLHFDLGKRIPALFVNVAFDRDGDGGISRAEKIAAEPRLANLRLETAEGTNLTCGPPEQFDVERNGPICGVLRWSGPLVDPDGKPGWAYVIRATLYAGRPEMRLSVTVINDNAEPKYREVKSLALRLPLEGEGGVRGGLCGGELMSPPDENGLWVQQDDEHRVRMWNGGERAGQRMPGVAVVTDAKARVIVAMRDFWQAYPSGFAVKPDGLHVRLLPPLAEDAHRDASGLDALKLFGWYRDGRYVFKAGQPVQKEIVVRYGTADDGTDPAAFAEWANAPLLPQAPAEYLCASGLLSRPIFPRTPGIWDQYERAFEEGFRASLKDREQQRTWGWMHFGDWFGERLLNYGNNEYDMSWAMALQWARTGDRRYHDRGLEMARHCSTIDTVHGKFSDGWNGLVYEHSFNHVGIGLSRDDPRLKEGLLAKYVAEYGAMLGGAIDRQGHVFQPGNWIYAALTGDGWLREVAARICDNQAARLTPAFDFSIERAGGWPIINMSMAHHFSGDPYYLNAARIMVERALQRQDPESGGWLHWHAGSESGGEQGMGGKAFAVAILSHGLLRYLEQEPRSRPDVERMLVRGADFLRDHAWVPGKGFRYISHLKHHADKPRRGGSEGLSAELVAFAYERTRDEKYLDLLEDMLAGHFDRSPGGNGKSFTQHVRQTVFGLDRMRGFGMTNAPTGEASR